MDKKVNQTVLLKTIWTISVTHLSGLAQNIFWLFKKMKSTPKRYYTIKCNMDLIGITKTLVINEYEN